MKTYQEFIKILKDLQAYTDHEASHILADGYLIEIAKYAAMGYLNKQQVDTLVDEYNKIHKWYA